MDTASQIEKRLYENIPLTKEIGIKVLNFNNDSLILSAPLDKNINDKNAAFAGSIFSVLVLSGWTLISQKLINENINAEVVNYKSEIIFLKPIKKDITAECRIDDNDWAAFKKNLLLNGSNKITMQINIFIDKEQSVSFKSKYYALLK